MLRNSLRVRTMFVLLLLLLTTFGLAAQDEVTPEVTQEPQPQPQEPPSFTVTQAQPARITQGEEAQITVFGTGFVQGQMTVWLDNYGLLETTFVSPTALTAIVPENVAKNEYLVKVVNQAGEVHPDPALGETVIRLVVVPPPATAAPPQPTDPPPPTAEPPTPIPGEPSLVVRNYQVNPQVVPPGGTVTLTLEIVNQGNRPAQGVSVAIDTGGTFVPASGQAAAILPDLPPGGSFVTTLNAVAAMSAEPGPTSVGITMNYRDFEGENFSTKATITATVEERAAASQVILARYLTDPNPVLPGQPVTITVLVTNTGNEIARQVLFKVATGESGILLAGPQGDSFPIGDLAPGASASLDLPLIVSSEAKSGPQSQAITMTYLQKGESKDVTGSMTIEVAKFTPPSPLLLLESYDIGGDVLQPGDQFTMTMSLHNVGDADATEVTVTFGTVESTGGDDDDGSSGDNGGSNGGTNTTPSTTFAPLGAGGTMYIGTLPANGESITMEQDFIVNGGVDSGIYSLPITLRYRKPDGSAGQDNLRASVVVLVPPRLRINTQTPLVESVNVGDTIPFSLEVINTGKKDVNFTFVNVTAENADVLDGAEIFLGPLRVDDDTTVDAMLSPIDEGPVTITITFNYLDDLNQERTIVETYETEALLPPEMPEEIENEIPIIPVPTEEPPQEDLLGRLLLGLLGLGS